MQPAIALLWTERLLALVVAIAALELLAVRHALRDDATFRWSTLRQDYAGSPRLVRTLLDATLGYRPFCAILTVQLAAALALPLSAGPTSALVLTATTLLVAIRFRGSYNGGSDALTLVILLSVSVARLVSDPRVARACLGYIAAQLVLSYFVAGVSKLGEPSWRSGTALPRLLALAEYDVSPTLQQRFTEPRVARLAAWGVIAFECSFPLALVSRPLCLALLALGVCFHLANARVLGLNRFFVAWLAAYPALAYWTS